MATSPVVEASLVVSPLSLQSIISIEAPSRTVIHGTLRYVSRKIPLKNNEKEMVNKYLNKENSPQTQANLLGFVRWTGWISIQSTPQDSHAGRYKGHFSTKTVHYFKENVLLTQVTRCSLKVSKYPTLAEWCNTISSWGRSVAHLWHLPRWGTSVWTCVWGILSCISRFPGFQSSYPP